MNPVLSGEFSGGTAQRRKLRTAARRPSVPMPRGHPWPAGDALSQDTPLRPQAQGTQQPRAHKAQNPAHKAQPGTEPCREHRISLLATSVGSDRCGTPPAATDIAHDATSRQIHPQMERSPKKSSPCLTRSNKCPSGQAAIRGRPGVARAISSPLNDRRSSAQITQSRSAPARSLRPRSGIRLGRGPRE
jgi:hypothetical protein